MSAIFKADHNWITQIMRTAQKESIERASNYHVRQQWDYKKFCDLRKLSLTSFLSCSPSGLIEISVVGCSYFFLSTKYQYWGNTCQHNYCNSLHLKNKYSLFLPTIQIRTCGTVEALFNCSTRKGNVFLKDLLTFLGPVASFVLYKQTNAHTL